MSLKAPLFSLALLAAVVTVFTPAAVAQADGFTCRASALRVTSPAVNSEPVVANAANNPCADASAGLANVAGPGFAASALTAQTDAQPSGATSTASVARVQLALSGIPTITAEVLRSNAAVTCTHGVPFHPGRPAFSGSSSIAALTFGGVAIVVTGTPNQTIGFPGVTIVINEQIQQPDRITVRALRVSSTALSTDVIVAESIADVSGNHPCV